MSTIGKRIRFARKSNDLTLTAINRLTGLSTGNLSELENDKFLPSANALIQFKKLYNVSIDWILTGEEAKQDHAPECIQEPKEQYLNSEYTEDERQLIEAYRKLDDQSKRDLWGYIKVVTSANNDGM